MSNNNKVPKLLVGPYGLTKVDYSLKNQDSGKVYTEPCSGPYAQYSAIGAKLI